MLACYNVSPDALKAHVHGSAHCLLAQHAWRMNAFAAVRDDIEDKVWTAEMCCSNW